MGTTKNNEPNLTWELEMTEESDGDIDGQLVVPKEATEAVITHLADRCGLTVEQTKRFLTELAATASEQVSKHPNRYFVIPGLGAMQLIQRGGSVAGRPVQSKRLSFKLAQPILHSVLRSG